MPRYMATVQQAGSLMLMSSTIVIGGRKRSKLVNKGRNHVKRKEKL